MDGLSINLIANLIAVNALLNQCNGNKFLSRLKFATLQKKICLASAVLKPVSL